MDIRILQGDIFDQECDILIVSVVKGLPRPTGVFATLNTKLEGALMRLLQEDGFQGKLGEWSVFPTFGKMKAKKIGVIGLGDRSTFTVDAARKIGGFILRRSRDASAKRVATVLHGADLVGLPARDLAQALGEGMRLGAYHFHVYKEQEGKEAKEKEVKEILICERMRSRVAPAERGLELAEQLSASTILARDLVNTPSAEMTPLHLADVAKKIAEKGKEMSVKLLDQEAMEKMGMCAALAVARGSIHPPIGVHMIYKPKGKTKKRIVIIGKAVTFDSGGLSIKPADGMMTMKIDMAGAASVLGLFDALPSLHLPLEIHGIFLGVENMPSGNAYRPGDVVKAMNGKTIEVLNTDAEGRVTLADALSYAQTLEPDVMIDLATLTGACVVALGDDIAAVLSNDKKLTQRLLAASEESGELLWQLPLHTGYQDHIKSRVADIKNIGQRGAAGTISAALFLSHFVGKVPWAHLDIAGPSYTERETRPDVPFGGTGYGVRLLVRYLQAL